MTDDLRRIIAMELESLGWHWGGAYVIGFESGLYTARRRDDGSAVKCVTAEDLWREIRFDYEARPVPRRR